MTDDVDVLARLRAADPVPDVEALPGPGSVRGQQLYERVVRSPLRARRRWRWPVVGLVVVVGGAAAGALFLRAPDEVVDVACFTSPSRAGDAAVEAVVDDPVTTCRELWRAGVLTPGPGVVVADDAPDGVPPLVVCTLPSGGIGVFPVAACGDVVEGDVPGTPAPTRDDAGLAEAAEVRRLVAAMADVVIDAPCPAPAVTLATWRGLLADSTLEGWRVVGDADASGCASLAVDERERTFRMVVGPPDPGSGPTLEAMVAARLTAFIDDRCLEPDVVAAEARDALDAFGLSAHDVTVLDGFDAERPCALVVFDGDDPVLLVVPSARR